jgi:hypothetical protein
MITLISSYLFVGLVVGLCAFLELRFWNTLPVTFLVTLATVLVWPIVLAVFLIDWIEDRCK